MVQICYQARRLSRTQARVLTLIGIYAISTSGAGAVVFLFAANDTTEERFRAWRLLLSLLRLELIEDQDLQGREAGKPHVVGQEGRRGHMEGTGHLNRVRRP